MNKCLHNIEKVTQETIENNLMYFKVRGSSVKFSYSKTMSMFYFCESFLVSLARTKADNTVINLGIHVEVLFVVCQ